MSLIRQLWLLLLGTVLAGVLGSVLVTVGAARGYLQTQLQLKNADNAQSLALALSQQRGDPALIGVVLSAQFDTGAYERIKLVAPDGKLLADHRAEPQPVAAPRWFVRAVPIASVPGVAQVSDGWKVIGGLEVVSASRFAHEALWRGSLRSAAWLALVGGLTAALAAVVLGRIREPLAATVAQARALVERRFVTVPEPDVPELRQLGGAMNAMVQRLQSVFTEQAAQLEALRRQSQSDALTGLAHRAHFLNRLGSLLVREDGPAAGTLQLVRLRDLAALNRELGHADTDALLRAVAAVLERSVAQAGEGGLAGRLNGSDFALSLEGSSPSEAGPVLLAELRTALAPWPRATLAVGALAWKAGSAAGSLMQRADELLVRAELQDGHGLAVETALRPDAATGLGETQWRRRLQDALQRADAELGAFPVLDRDGRLLHLECPLRLRLESAGPLEPAGRWLAWAVRGRFTAEADLLATRLALELIAQDGRPRGVNLAPASLADSGFVAGLREHVRRQPQAAANLWLEIGERAAVEQRAQLRELVDQLHPFGVKLGLEHAGERLARIERLYETGLDYVKLDASLSAALAGDERRLDFLRGLVGMLHGLGMQVHAEGVSAGTDADALWQCGLDGVTGPWATAHEAKAGSGG